MHDGDGGTVTKTKAGNDSAARNAWETRRAKKVASSDSAGETAPAAEKSMKANAPKNGTGGGLANKAMLWAAADKLRNNVDATECKHGSLGLTFLKYISDAFLERHAQLLTEKPHGAHPEDRVPKEARWPAIQAKSTDPGIHKVIDDAMVAIGCDNTRLKGAQNE